MIKIRNNKSSNFSVNDLIEVSDIILTGEVAEIKPAAQFVDSQGTTFIYTDIIIKPEHYLLGGINSQNVAIRTIGGRMGNIISISENTPILKL